MISTCFWFVFDCSRLLKNKFFVSFVSTCFTVMLKIVSSGSDGSCCFWACLGFVHVISDLCEVVFVFGCFGSF